MPLNLGRFPNSFEGCHERSPRDVNYNCIAFAAGDTARPWWPNTKGAYWPENVPARETVYAFLSLYRSLGYESCDDGALENGFEKVAIYALDNKVKHAARQLPNGNWVSKIGQNIDVEHDTVATLEGPFYGTAVRYLKRPIQN